MTATEIASPVVRVAGLSKSFSARRSLRSAIRHPARRDRIAVLHDVSLEIARGEFFGLLGPNGAGKTTLFKILSTLVIPDRGRVEIAGFDAATQPGAVRRILTPVIADERSLNWRLTGQENLRLYAALYGIPAQEQPALIHRTLDAVGLAEAGSRMAGTYSTGMKQRLLIGRALLSRPAVLLLDEPTRSLDPVSARNFRKFLRDEVAGQHGCTVLLATHDAEEALGLCDRLAVLHEGHIVAQGPPAELARAAGEQRFRIWVRHSDVAATRDVLHRLGLREFEAPVAPVGEEWIALEGDIPGGLAASAAVLRSLGDRAITPAEFSRIPLPLSDIIERLVAQGVSA